MSKNLFINFLDVGRCECFGKLFLCWKVLFGVLEAGKVLLELLLGKVATREFSGGIRSPVKTRFFLKIFLSVIHKKNISTNTPPSILP